jgi:hypothetical protein
VGRSLAKNPWIEAADARDQAAEVVAAAVASVREVLTPYVDGASVRLPGAAWLVSTAPA